jgi:hypothetical protein
MPTKHELIEEIRAILVRSGANYGDAGTRDKHYAIWIFAMILDEASALGGAFLVGLHAGRQAVFRGNPGDLQRSGWYTNGVVRGGARDWEVHVDVNIAGSSGASHGVDVSMIPVAAVQRAYERNAAPKIDRGGLGIEAKCFTKPLTPNEGRVTLGFQLEVGGDFWLAANRDNQTVRTVLDVAGRRTRFFPDLKPGSASETDFRGAVQAQLRR